MRIFLMACVFPLLILGCTSSHTVGTKESGADYDFESLNRQVEKRECTAIFANGEQIKAKDIITSKDSVSLLTYVRIGAPKSRVSKIRRSEKGSEVVLNFMDGEPKEVNGVIVTRDSVLWLNWTKLTIPTSQLSKVFYVDPYQGFVDGLLVGVVGGAGTLFVVGMSLQPKYATDGGGGAGGLIALIAGTGVFIVSPIVGLSRGHTEEFRFSAP